MVRRDKKESGMKLDTFMKNIENNIAKGQGIRGFKKMKTSSFAFDEE